MTQGKEIPKRAQNTIERCYSQCYGPSEIKELLDGRGYDVSYSAIYALKEPKRLGPGNKLKGEAIELYLPQQEKFLKKMEKKE